MTEAPWLIRHIDLADGPRELPACDRAQFVTLWWRSLPLGSRALLPGETPVHREQTLAWAADLIADQAAGRSGLLPTAGTDGQPRAVLDRKAAIGADRLLDWLDTAGEPSAASAERLSVVICTRDRPAMLRACLGSLAAQRSPPGEIVVVDNSTDASARAICADRAGVIFVHEPRPGLSLARNAGVAAAHGEFIAFTDDDVELHDGWTGEIVRAFGHRQADAVTGLVLPARLDTAAQRAFQLHLGGFTSRYTPLLFDEGFLAETRAIGPQVWRIGAGANMAFRRSVFARVGGFDERLGAGASGCSEDSEFWYRILAAGGECLYEPRAVVFHHHREDWAGLRRQYRAYMKGHVAALVAQSDRYGPSGDMRRIFRQLPAYFVGTGLAAVRDLAGWRLRLLLEEVVGWAMGLQYLVRPAWRRKGRTAARRDAASVLPATEAGHA